MGPFIREIVSYLLKLKAFNMHVMHYMHYVLLKLKKYLIRLEETWIIFLLKGIIYTKTCIRQICF